MANILYSKNELTDERGRSFFLDNAKFILIFFVVLAHALSPYRESSSLAGAIWAILNNFHMPCFIFISGYLARGFLKKDPLAQVQRVATYVILYIVSQISVAAFEKFVLLPFGYDGYHGFSVFNARSSLWFLVCLCVWYIMLPVIGRLKWYFVIPGAVAFALYIGYDTQVSNFMSLSRVFVHLPFFLAGYHITPKIFEFIRRRWVKIVSAVVLVGTLAGYYLISKFVAVVPSALLTANTPYEKMGLDILKDRLPYPLLWLTRVYFYISAAVLIVAFLAVVPRCKTFFSKWGSRTLSVYILHRFLYLAYLHFEWYKVFGSGITALLIVFGVTLVVTVILSLWPCDYPFKMLQKIKITRLVKDEYKAK